MAFICSPACEYVLVQHLVVHFISIYVACFVYIFLFDAQPKVSANKKQPYYNWCTQKKRKKLMAIGKKRRTYTHKSDKFSVINKPVRVHIAIN